MTRSAQGEGKPHSAAEVVDPKTTARQGSAAAQALVALPSGWGDEDFPVEGGPGETASRGKPGTRETVDHGNLEPGNHGVRKNFLLKALTREGRR